ncbi:MAG: LysM peptidoglycan-binding domain-containing protein [Anaerolineaceae bacterium]
MKTPKIISAFAFVFFLFGLLILQPFLSSPANAQVFIYTATPESNGNIYYIVKSGDTCQSISLLNEISIDQLRAYNQLELNDCDALTIGRKLLIGIVPTAVITAGPSPTPTSNLPTPIPVIGQGSICVYLFNDINGNAIAETGETSLAGGEISIVNTSANFSQTAPSTGDDLAVCFSNINEGTYTISVAIPDGYNPTTSQNRTIQLKAGDTSTVDFGAQASSRLNIGNSSGGSSILLAVVGGFILIAGIAVGLYAYFTMKKK